jgi:hypothetical protein
MEIFETTELVTIIVLLCVCLITVGSLALFGFVFFRVFRGMAADKALLESGLPAPAVILSVEDTGVTMNDNPQARLTLQVTPPNRPPFQAVVTTFVGRLQIGMLVPGQSVSVRYDPNDISKVAIESMGAPAPNPASVAAAEASIKQQEDYFQELRQRGEEALATILTIEELNIRVENAGSLFRLTLYVTPSVGQPFQSESQVAIRDATRANYQVGTTLYVYYDPADKSRVAISRPA